MAQKLTLRGHNRAAGIGNHPLNRVAEAHGRVSAKGDFRGRESAGEGERRLTVRNRGGAGGSVRARIGENREIGGRGRGCGYGGYGVPRVKEERQVVAGLVGETEEKGADGEVSWSVVGSQELRWRGWCRSEWVADVGRKGEKGSRRFRRREDGVSGGYRYRRLQRGEVWVGGVVDGLSRQWVASERRGAAAGRNKKNEKRATAVGGRRGATQRREQKGGAMCRLFDVERKR